MEGLHQKITSFTEKGMEKIFIVLNEKEKQLESVLKCHSDFHLNEKTVF